MPDVTLKMQGLEKLLKALGGKPVMGKIGILGSGNVRGDGNSNAEIGAKHEFGLGVPVRSWLRLPLMTQLDPYLKKAGAFDRAVLRMVLETGTMEPFMERVMIVAETVVMDAFDSAGFGTWPPSDMRYKKNHQTLVETQQLMDSVTSEVK